MATSAMIRFRMSNASDARLAIYDAAGRLVRDLVNQHLEAGAHQCAGTAKTIRVTPSMPACTSIGWRRTRFTQSRRLLVVH
ncbi:MAG: hypothetical protein R3E12_20045 [Candidatus Eisenbacteria bacterium]